MRRRILKATRRKYVVISFVMIIIHPVNVQFAMPVPMYGAPAPQPPQMYAVAQPMPPPPPPPPVFALPPPPIQVAFLPPPPPQPQPPPRRNDNIAVAYPVPMQMPMQVAVPAQPPSFCGRPGLPGCPPCPPCLCTPSCTPAFFSYCSPCHQQCRCKDRADVPRPLPAVAPVPAPGPAFPMPMPMAPPSVVVVPVPPMMRRPPPRRYESSCSDETSSSDDSSSCDSSDDRRRTGKHSKKRRFHKFNRRRTITFRRRNNDDGDTIIKPVLSFINQRGDVKINKQLNDFDVAALMGDSSNDLIQEQTQRPHKRVQNVRVMAEDDEDKKGQVLVISDFNNKFSNSRRNDKGDSSDQKSEKKLHSGRKQLIFKPPENKKISNFSVSFQVSK